MGRAAGGSRDSLVAVIANLSAESLGCIQRITGILVSTVPPPGAYQTPCTYPICVHPRISEVRSTGPKVLAHASQGPLVGTLVTCRDLEQIGVCAISDF